MTRALRNSRRKAEKTIDFLHRANRELALTQRNLVHSEKMAAVDHLAAGLAHELGNPLGAATGYLQMIQAETKTEETRDMVTRTLQELDRIDRLVRELLDLLGLFFCHWAVEEAGGAMEVMSRTEQGTRFSIHFPSQPVEKCA